MERTPATIALTGATRTRVRTGESGAIVEHVRLPDGVTAFLKYGTGFIGSELAVETRKLQWISQRIATPCILDAGHDGDITYQLTSALAGESAYTVLARDPSQAVWIVPAIAAFLRRMHEIPLHSCPFDTQHLLRLADARQNIDIGRVNTDDFDDVRSGWSAEQVWEALQAHLPLHVEPVVTHGDFSLDNIFVDAHGVTGCLDVGRLGVADRYQDLAILWNNLAEFGEPAQAALFTAYGITQPDATRLEFHLLLDELF